MKMNTNQLFLILVMAYGVTCLSLPKLLRRPQQKENGVSRFNVKITESGTTFNEEVEIDTKENTETFHVAPHNNVDLSDVMHIFQLNRTIYRFPIKGVCYLAPLKRDQPPPEKLENDMSKVSQENDDEGVMTEASSYVITGKLTDRRNWDQRIQTFCRDLDVYLVKKVDKNSLTIKSDDEGRRQRRQSNSGAGNCPQSQIGLCPMDKVVSLCQIQGRTCTYFRTCSLVFNANSGSFETKCNLKHIFDEQICCQRTCTD